MKPLLLVLVLAARPSPKARRAVFLVLAFLCCLSPTARRAARRIPRRMREGVGAVLLGTAHAVDGAADFASAVLELPASWMAWCRDNLPPESNPFAYMPGACVLNASPAL